MSEPNRRKACLRCRVQKVKCDRLKPHCSRCVQFHKECSYPSGVTKRSRRPATEILQERALELEMTINKLTLSSTHNLALASEKLLWRIERLGCLPKHNDSLSMGDELSSLSRISNPEVNPTLQRAMSALSDSDTTIGDLFLIRKVVEQELLSYDLEEMKELPPSLSLHLINLFLPQRSQYYFLQDASYFRTCLSLPSSHPDSIHPCLLNACYLGACTSNGGDSLAQFKPFFLRRTRHFLDRSLACADRITHFLWASLILAIFFAREHRLEESLVVSGATIRFALACGLELPGRSTQGNNDSYPINYLLPPPMQKNESEDRIRLTFAIYSASQAFRLLCGSIPIILDENDWPPILRDTSLKRQDGMALTKTEEFWRLELLLKVSIANTLERAMRFARRVLAESSCDSTEEYLAIETQIRMHQAFLPPLPDPLRVPSLKGLTAFSPSLVLGHVTLHGTGLILHSSRAVHNAESRVKLLECLERLIDISIMVQNQRQPHLGLLNIFHIMNAVRVIARELHGPAAKENVGRSINYCQSIEVLLEFLDKVMIRLPAWVEAPLTLKDTLIAAAHSLSG
ncbi:hypothetical protein DL93DRAFT_1796444 [Clavulina sp. PMI_390]|nr:hypothetical protein DL93DRAFT_1796444 [Clavulina sp. PMI_390]